MSTPQLKELMNTAYIIDDMCNKLTGVLDTVDELDLAGCKFGVAAEQTLRRYYGKVEFSNSKNAYLDEILKHNNKAVKVEDDSILLDANLSDVNSILEYLKTFDRTKKYNLNFGYSIPKKVLALVIIIVLRFPEVEIDVGSSMQAILKIVRSQWLPYAKSHDEYWQCIGMGLIRVSCKDGIVTDAYGKQIREEEFVKGYVSVPYEFGTKLLWNDPEYEGVQAKALSIISQQVEVKKKMIDYIRDFGRD